MDQANLAGHPTATAGHAFPLLCDFVRASVSSSVTAVVTGPGKQGAEISEKGDVLTTQLLSNPDVPPAPSPGVPFFHISVGVPEMGLGTPRAPRPVFPHGWRCLSRLGTSGQRSRPCHPLE